MRPIYITYLESHHLQKLDVSQRAKSIPAYEIERALLSCNT